MKIQKNIFYDILLTCPDVPPETGGLLGGKDGVITHFFADPGTGNGYDRYVPNVQCLNVILDIWQKKNIRFYGLYHSHFPNGTMLSDADCSYIATLLRATSSVVDELFFPIVLPKDKMVAYRAFLQDGNVCIKPDGIILVKI